MTIYMHEGKHYELVTADPHHWMPQDTIATVFRDGKPFYLVLVDAGDPANIPLMMALEAREHWEDGDYELENGALVRVTAVH